MTGIVILGTRYLAEELFDLISEIPGYEVAAFVDNEDRDRCAATLEGRPVVWVDDLPRFARTHLALCGISTTHRWRYAEQAAALGMRFATLVHPTARVSARATLGEGCFIGPMAVVSTRAVLGRHVFANRGALIGHHRTIGDFVTIQPGANIAGAAAIGARTYIGMGAVVADRVDIGEGCIVAAGAVVVENVPDRVQVMGVPAKIVKTGIDPR